MKSKLLNQGPERTYAVVLDPGDEVVHALQEFAAQHGLTASRVTAIATCAGPMIPDSAWH
jgi:uncharacterized protein